MGARNIARGIALGVAAMALNVAFAFAWVYFYSVAIDPGHGGAFYQAYARTVAPISSIVAGIPILLTAGWLAAKGAAAAALIPAASYILLDLSLLAAGGIWPPPFLLAWSYLTKLAAAWAGGRLATRRRAS